MMSIEAKQLAMKGLLTDEIYAIIQYATNIETGNRNEPSELHNALEAMHNDFPAWLQQRITFLENAIANSAKKEESRA